MPDPIEVLKQKYPQYAHIENHELARLIVKKYPQYKQPFSHWLTQGQQIDHAKHVAGQIVQKHISPNSGASGVIQYPHTSIGPPDAAPHQNMVQRGISAATDALSTPAAMVKSAVQPLAARMFPSKEPPLSPLTGDPTDRYEELRVAAMPYWERVQYMKSQPMKHVANPSKQYQDQVWLDKQPFLSHVMEHGGELAAGMASDPTTYALGAGWLSKAPKVARAVSAGFSAMQVAPYIANPSMLKDPKALIDIPLAIVAAWHAAGLKMPAPIQNALHSVGMRPHGALKLSKADAAKLSEQFAQKEHRYNSEFKSKAPDKPGVQRGLPKAELPKAKEKTNAVQKQSAEKSVPRRQRPKVELQGVGEGHAEEASGTRKGKAKEVDPKPSTAVPTQASLSLVDQIELAKMSIAAAEDRLNKADNPRDRQRAEARLASEKAKLEELRKPNSTIVSKQQVSTAPKEGSRAATTSNKESASIFSSPSRENIQLGEEGGYKTSPEIRMVQAGIPISEFSDEELNDLHRLAYQNMRMRIDGIVKDVPGHSSEWGRLVEEAERERSRRSDPERDTKRKEFTEHATPTERPKPGSVPGERETNAGGRVPARPSTSSSKAGADKGAAAPVQPNKVQIAKPQAQVAESPGHTALQMRDNINSLMDDPKFEPSLKGPARIRAARLAASEALAAKTETSKSLTSETSKPTHVNKTVFRQSIDKLKALGHDVEQLEGGYRLYTEAKTPGDIKAASLALRDELQKTAAKTPAKAPSKPAQAAKPGIGTNVPTTRKRNSGMADFGPGKPGSPSRKLRDMYNSTTRAIKANLGDNWMDYAPKEILESHFKLLQAAELEWHQEYKAKKGTAPDPKTSAEFVPTQTEVQKLKNDISERSQESHEDAVGRLVKNEFFQRGIRSIDARRRAAEEYINASKPGIGTNVPKHKPTSSKSRGAYTYGHAPGSPAAKFEDAVNNLKTAIKKFPDLTLNRYTLLYMQKYPDSEYTEDDLYNIYTIAKSKGGVASLSRYELEELSGEVDSSQLHDSPENIARIEEMYQASVNPSRKSVQFISGGKKFTFHTYEKPGDKSTLVVSNLTSEGSGGSMSAITRQFSTYLNKGGYTNVEYHELHADGRIAARKRLFDAIKAKMNLNEESLKPRSTGHVGLSKEKIDENYGKDFPPESGQTFRGNGGAPQGGRQAAGSVPQGWEAAGEAGNAKNISGKQRPPIVVGKHTGTVYITDPMAWHQIATAAGTKDALASRGFFAQQMTVDSIASKLPNKMAQDFLRAAKGGASVVNISKFRGNANITDVVRHEPVHEAQHRIYANSPSETTRSGRTYKQIADHMDDTAYTKAHQKLKSMGYVSPDVEVPAWIIAGQYKPLGLTDSEAAQVISQFYDDVNRNHGPIAAASLFKRAIGPARAVSRAARSRSGMAAFGGPGRPGSPQARVTSAVRSIISRVKTYAPTEKTGGRYHMTAVIDPETADLEHTLSNTDSYGDQLGSRAFSRVTAGLDAKEKENFVRFMQSNNLAVDNPAHPSVLTNRRMENIWGKPGVPLTVSQAKIQAASILHSEVQSELFGLVKKGKPSVRKKVGLTYSGPGGEDLFMNMIPKKDAAGNPVMINPKPGAASRRVASQMKVNSSKAALPRAGTAAEYETDLEKIYQQAYKNALPGAIKSDIYAGMAKKGLAKYTTGAYPKTITYNGVEYPATTELVRKGKKPGEVGTIDINITMPAQIHTDIKDATSAKPFAKNTYIDPNAHGGPKTKSSSQARDAQNALTDAQLASPKVITGHSLRVITMVTKMVDPSLPGIRKAVDTLFNAPTLGIVPRLTRLYDLANLDPTSTTEYISKEGYKYSNQSIRVDLARANAVDNRTFDNTSALGKVPGIRQMREMGHGALFSDPKGPSDLFKAKTVSDLAKSIQEFGLDIRAKVMIEKVRRMADGYDPKDPKLDDKIRNNAYKLGEYVKKPNKYVEFLKTLNTYAGTSAPMRKTELQQFFGNTGISGKALSPAQREVYRAQTLAMSGIGTFMGYVMWNKLLSGHMPWDNKSDNTLEFGNGWHLSMSAINPADTRAMSTLGLLRSARGLETGNYSDIPKAIGKGVIGAAADLVTGPGVRMMATAAGADLYLIDPNGNAMLAKAYPGAQYPLPSSLYDDDDSGKDTYAKRFRAVLGEVNPVGETFMDLLGGSSNSLSALRSPRSTYDSSEVNPWDSLWRHVKSADTLFNSPLIQEDKEPKSSGALDPETQKYMRQQEQYQKIGQPSIEKEPVHK